MMRLSCLNSRLPYKRAGKKAGLLSHRLFQLYRVLHIPFYSQDDFIRSLFYLFIRFCNLIVHQLNLFGYKTGFKLETRLFLMFEPAGYERSFQFKFQFLFFRSCVCQSSPAGFFKKGGDFFPRLKRKFAGEAFSRYRLMYLQPAYRLRSRRTVRLRQGLFPFWQVSCRLTPCRL